ncbi:MAGUK p55 subfamily member 3 isoform X1 [Kryptolebias marmoratus]|uniref:MAGUK p55 scaffold protein 3a n=1 Tax=Kryptolebias marmoratus TaxID=37003 RepID=A0A3Q3AC67_KRYMA|nr:MAGUK p55 subfamily member 3 isoform X1 [Kryptolebias marmoratus]XP_017274945.1 MAGUK p55 subfamily member 3 isoform X1 [Kryptolebias marmoratus]XP_017274946.1 MAGUK p55 subfamily member 3 isoform X1 [Kryptolebias marmoratus]XP_017274947.1 MAGUK p55 subfamily member 3 isoform X1 [Kryptolebias marmoratus]XP_037834651.1 MAGUK p55 subfamily member 3 isoform X1 [Kryptolebias marmoratus]
MKEAMPVLTAGAGLHETLALLTSQLRPDANHKEDMVFLKDVFSERSLAYLMKIHEKLRQYERQSPAPVLDSAASLAEDVAEELQGGPMSTEEKELLHLLTSPHLKAVLSVHDTVAQKNFDPVLPPLPDDFEDELDEESVKIVRLVKNKEPLGATIRRDEATGVVIVARIMRGGAADRSGLVHVGDELREVNGVSVIHKRPDEISQLLSQSQGSITLKIIPAVKEEDRLKDSKVYMRALFDYTPLEDKATPCQEAGLPFKRGDILQVVTQDDPTWWQAKRVGDSNLRAGLIPSKQFQERRLAYRMKMGTLPNPKSPKKPASEQGCDKEDCDCEGYFNGQYIVSPKCKAVAPSCGQVFSWEFYSAGLRRSFRLSRKDRQGSAGEGSETGEPEFLTYEEVTRFQQRPNERPRLVVLIGSLGARINELKQRVIAENPHRYAVAVPHTTRPKKAHEKDGVEYHFVTKQQFDADVLNNKFIEHGEYKENQYGTSIEAIRSVQAKNKMCIVDVQPEALKRLRTAEFKPYVVFVKPRIPESRRRRSAATSPGGGDHGRVTDEDLQEMRQSAVQIDQQYGHLVDRVLIKEDSASACAELRGILERLERESLWVPTSWVRT